VTRLQVRVIANVPRVPIVRVQEAHVVLKEILLQTLAKHIVAIPRVHGKANDLGFHGCVLIESHHQILLILHRNQQLGIDVEGLMVATTTGGDSSLPLTLVHLHLPVQRTTLEHLLVIGRLRVQVHHLHDGEDLNKVAER